MNSSEFNRVVDETLIAIEDALEDALDTMDGDLDYESTNGILTITCDNGSKVIINRQSAADQLWLATKSGGFHYDWDGEQWLCDKEKSPLTKRLNQALSAQTGETIELTLDIDL